MSSKIDHSFSHADLQNIVELLGMIEEKNLSKDWLISELKRHHIRSLSPPTSNLSDILMGCKPKEIKKILEFMKKEDLSIKDLNALTRTLHWFFIDMIASSDPKLSVKNQARKINALNAIIEQTETFKTNNLQSLELLPTGDGMAIGFPDSSEKPVLLAIQLHKGLRKYNSSKKEKDKILVRIGIDTGPVYFMKGIGGGKIFWGPGLIRAKRVMDLCSPNQILASERIAKDLRRLSEENKAAIRPIGEYDLKHGESIEIFNIFGKDFGNKLPPKKSKVPKQKTYEYDLTKPNFEFKNIILKLDVTNVKNMMTHHTWIWDIRNTSDDLLNQINYEIGGDTSKEFSDMNVSVKDENDNELEIISIDINKPHEKRFKVKFNKPLRKNKSAKIKFEYDWEEPYRTFEYTFSSLCKKFRYEFTIPKQVQIKHRILEVAPNLGIKKLAEPPAKINYLDKKTVISWETSGNRTINAHETFEFQW